MFALEGCSFIAFSAGLFPDGYINLNSVRSRIAASGFSLVSLALGSSHANSLSRTKTSRMNTGDHNPFRMIFLYKITNNYRGMISLRKKVGVGAWFQLQL